MAKTSVFRVASFSLLLLLSAVMIADVFKSPIAQVSALGSSSSSSGSSPLASMLILALQSKSRNQIKMNY